jgi:hypothetical protein
MTLKIVLLVCAMAMPLHAEDAPLPRPDGVGEPLALNQFQDLLSNSPFRRLMSFSEDLVLTGVAKLPSGTVVTVYNRRAEETYSVDAQENAQGWRLLEVTGGRELEDVVARIQVGKQEVTLRFDPRRIRPESIRRIQPRTVKPGKAPEKASVVQWLARLEPDLLKTYDQLGEVPKENFRYTFESYLEEYPNASSELRVITARENLQTLKEQEERERQASPNNLEKLNVGSQ